MSAVECGAACLAMILTYYGRKTRLAECRETWGVGRDGATAHALVAAARRHGLRVKAVSVELAEFEHVPLPAIVHWSFNHFVVVERWSPRRVEIVDPAAGRRTLPAEEFAAGFTGVVLAIEPGVHFERRDGAARPVWCTYLISLLRTPGTRGVLAQILGASLCLQALGLALPLFTKVVVDQVLPFRIVDVMTTLGLGMAVAVLAHAATSHLRAALLLYLQVRLDAQLMLGFFEHVLALPLRFFQQRSSGDLLTRLGSTMAIREGLTTQTLSLALDSTLVLGYLVVIFAQAPAFGLLVLGLGALQVALVLGTTGRMYGLMQRDLAAQAESQGYLAEALQGIATLKASGAEDRALDRWSDLVLDRLNVSSQRSYASAIVETATGTLQTSAPLILLWVGGMRVLDGAMSVGTMLALQALATAVLMPLGSLVLNGQMLQLVGAHLERIADVLDARPEQEPGAVQAAPRLTGRIEVKHLSHRYDPRAPEVLRDVSVTIEPGQKVALVGRTGSGKTTLAMLLLGLHPSAEGEIQYDGIPLHRLNYRALRRRCGVVLQEPSLFSGSIRRNIAFHDPGLPLDQVTAAARLAAIHDEIVQMPMGYETRVSEGGAGLSGGQRQRLALARALAQQPAILVLDEATSHLDVVTEGLVDRNVSALGCTRIVIAHRLSTIRNADLILVLDRGEIVERGSHDELLALGGRYAALVESQVGMASVRGLHVGIGLEQIGFGVDRSRSFVSQS
jgi:ABC-type bacteriocin/lantibiotic exporter with double-glycine peptidase domain